jgi:hypothetical protein
VLQAVGYLVAPRDTHVTDAAGGGRVGSGGGGGGGGEGDYKGQAGGGGGHWPQPSPRQTVTRVTANSLELHKIKEQARRAREKQLLARLQSLLFDGRESPPAASEVTYNLVLSCAVESLRDRYLRRGLDLSHINIDEAIAPEPQMTPRHPGNPPAPAHRHPHTLHPPFEPLTAS